MEEDEGALSQLRPRLSSALEWAVREWKQRRVDRSHHRTTPPLSLHADRHNHTIGQWLLLPGPVVHTRPPLTCLPSHEVPPPIPFSTHKQRAHKQEAGHRTNVPAKDTQRGRPSR